MPSFSGVTFGALGVQDVYAHDVDFSRASRSFAILLTPTGSLTAHIAAYPIFISVLHVRLPFVP
jgi:hypothetical protein